MKEFVLLALVFVVSQFAFADDLFVSANNPKPWVKSLENLPEVGQETTVYLGDVMLRQRKGYYEECLKSKINFSKKRMGSIYHIVDGGFVCKENKNDKTYIPDFATVNGPEKYGGRPFYWNVYLKQKKRK